MKYLTLSTLLFEDSRIKALGLQANGGPATLLWLKLFFSSAQMNADGTLMLYGNVPHDKTSIAAIYNLPPKTAENCLELLEKFELIDQKNGVYAITNFPVLTASGQKQKHRESQRRHTQRGREPGEPA